MNHTQLINYLIEKYDLKSYLEIGVRSTEQNFDKIKCYEKTGVDPSPCKNRFVVEKTSDEFFSGISQSTWDIIFIDGDHSASQVERDFNNSLKCLNDGGFIILHDTCPDKEEYTKVPRETKKWFGDVFSFAMQLGMYNGLNYFTIDEDCGMTICWKIREVTPPVKTYKIPFDDYLEYKESSLQIKSIQDLDKYLPKVKEAAR